MATSPNLDVRDLIGKPFERAFKLKKDVIDVDTRTARQVAITSDEPILHWVNGRGIAYVILDHAERSINLERFKAGAAFLENHNPDRRLGRGRNPNTDGHKLRADLRFSSRPYAEEIFREVQEDLEHGDSPGTSTGFTIERIADKVESYIEGIPVVRAIRWTPYEASLASMEADVLTGFGRCIGDRTAPTLKADDEEETDAAQEEDSKAPGKSATRNHQPPTEEVRTTNMETEAEKAARLAAEALANRTPAQLLQARTTEFVDTAALFGDTEEQKNKFRTMARTMALEDAKTLDDLKREILTSMKAAQEQAAVLDPKVVAARQGTVTVSSRRTQSLKVFKGEGGDLRAFRFWNGLLANAFHGRDGANRKPAIAKAYRYATENGLIQRAAEGQSEGDPEAGGFTVQEEWSPEVIDLHEEFGVIRRYSKVEPMAAEAKNVRRREGGLQFHAAGEGEDVEIEKKKWGGNKLVAKKWLCLANITSELSEDSAVNQADDLAYEMTLADAQLEDDLGFLADGTGSEQSETGFQGVVGVIPKILSLATNKAHIAGLVIANGTPTLPTQVPLVLGDLRMGTMLGDRSPLTISMSEHSSFRNDTIDLKGRIRLDFIAHSVGNADATATKRKAGPIVALATDDWDAIVSDDLNVLMGKLPRFRGIRPVFFCHQTFYFTVLRKILIAAGGATPGDLAGAGPFQFGGYPVEFCQNLPNAEVA